MKRDGKIVLVGAVLVGLVAFSAVKRGGRGETGKCSGGACCPMLPGLKVWSTNSWGQAAGTNAKPAAAVGETVTNRVR